jgi:hypothetical protein
MKKIEVVYLKPSELKLDFGNPRKIQDYKKEELKKSIEKFGDHDVIKINELHQVISGNQRIIAMISLNIDTPILCKKLIGYSENELKKINIDSNEHSGEWDWELKSKWEDEINDFEKDIDVEDKKKQFSNKLQCPKCGFIWQK